MIIYLTHDLNNSPYNLDNALQKLNFMQTKDKENTYICPLTTFLHLGENDLTFKEMLDIRLDLLSVCDKLLVASIDTDEFVESELDFADLVGLEVEFSNELRGI